MEEAEQSRYVAQLKAEFDSCDTTASGFLDRDELTELCRKLQLDTHLPLLLHTLLGESRHARVNFEEFKDGFVAVLSRSLDFSTSEEESSYLEPVVPEEVKPKFVKGTKRYGRRSRPDNKPDQALTCDSDDSPPSRTEPTDSSPAGVRRAKLRRSTSLESVESLKSDEEAAAQKNVQTECEPAAQQDRSVQDGVAECRGTEVLEELGGGGGGGALREELLLVCDQLGLQQLDSSELDVLLRKLDADLDGRVSLSEFQKVLCGSAPVCSSTPTRPHDPQRALHRVVEERPVLAVTVGQRLLSRLDDGSGCTSPDRVIALWTEEGLRNSRDILQTLDFPLEERLSLADLSLALDNELLVSGNGIHQAALICYKTEIQHLQQQVEQACRERDKVKSDLDLADRRNLQLVREVDDHQASMETLNQSRIRGLEQEFRDRLTALRSETEQESEVLLQQAERERNRLQDELQGLRSRDAQLQEELHAATQENQRLEEELALLKLKLTEAESSVSRLHRELELLLQDKFGSLDPAGAALSHEERFCEIIKEYELQCRELRDRNDELSSEVELLKSQRSDRKCSGCCGDAAALSWDERRCGGVESDSDDPDMKRGSTPPVRKRLQPADRSALGSLDSLSGPAVSIQTELALQQLTQKHQQEVQQLRIDLETKVNFYERSLEKMRQSMEVERKDISQAFKLEISELEEQKLQAEQQVKQLQESVEKLQTQIHQSSSTGGWSSEQERRAQREQAELEQNYAREISNLVQRLSAEKDQLEAELKLKMDQEVMLVREEAEQQLSQMKLQYAEAQRRLLHQLHRERQRLQEQRGAWESQLLCLQQENQREKLRCEERAGEEQARICSQFSSEKRSLEEQHEEEVRELKEQVSRLQEEAKTSVQDVEEASRLWTSQLEASLEELRERCGRTEEEHAACRARCCELEARLQEACTQLEESIHFLESHEVLNKRLTSEKCLVEEELELVKSREEQLLVQVSQLKQDLGDLQAASDSILQDKEVVTDNCSRLNTAFVQQQAQLHAKEQTVDALRSELENLQELMRTKVECLSKLTAELDSLKADRARLIQDLKDQAMAVDNLQLELDGITEELGRRRSAEESLRVALEQEQSKATKLQSSLNDEREEVGRLSQENGSYIRVADQLSMQIVEMEEEISTLRNHIRDLSCQLNETADLVLELRGQLNSRASEVDRLRAEAMEGAESHRCKVQQLTVQLVAKDRELSCAREEAEQQALWLRDAQAELRRVENSFAWEKNKMTEQLMDMEKLVLALEEVMDPASPHRTRLEEARSENSTLKDRLAVLQQEVQSLEDDIAKSKKKMDEMGREREKSREEEERLHKENSKYREEVLDLSSRNLQLSNDNAELSARLRGDQESVRMLRERLALVTSEQEEGGATVRRLQEAAVQQEREKLQQQAAWQQEKQLLDRELTSCKEKLGRLSELEAELSGVTLRQQWLEEDKARLLREADERNHKVEKLQESLFALDSETELLRSQLHAVSQEKTGHAQEVGDLQRKLQEAQDKVVQLEASVRRLNREKEELLHTQQEQQEQACLALQEESHKLRLQNQELLHRLSELQVHSLEVQRLTQECENLKSKQNQLETARTQAQDQAARADAALSLAESQHARRLQELKEQAGAGRREQLELLQARLAEEQRRSQQLEEKLRVQNQQSSSQFSLQQEQYEKAMASMQEKMEEVEVKLKGVRLVLQEKVEQLKEQLAKNAKSGLLLKDLYVENSQLMKALQVTEQRQKSAEKKNFLLEEKIAALNKLLREIVPASLAT
ncbi:ninein-like protein [Myripristis murdjan]|uniref:ninein-like protein n=1 Tax=Myripristis murdjan TaxID=586833 RepID=UPI001175D6A5|nr:ninein-like protein [Myripristis murdjan]